MKNLKNQIVLASGFRDWTEKESPRGPNGTKRPKKLGWGNKGRKARFKQELRIGSGKEKKVGEEQWRKGKYLGRVRSAQH